MNRRFGFFILPVIALATVAAVMPQGVLLRRELKEGNIEDFRIDLKGDVLFSVPSMGDQQMAITGGMNYGIKLGKVDAEKGVAEAEFRVSDMDFKMEGALADMAQGMPPMPKEAKLAGTVDTRGRMAMKPTGMEASMMMAMGPSMSSMGQGFEFPEKAVNVGDTWDVVVPKNPMMSDKDAVLKAKLVGESDQNGVPAYEIGVDGAIPFNPDMAAMVKALPADASGMAGMLEGMQMKGTMDLKTKGFVEKATGKMLSLETTSITKASLTIMGMDIPVSWNMKMTMKRKPAQ